MLNRSMEKVVLKKFLALVLCTALIFTNIPAAIFTKAEETGTTEEHAISVSQGSPINLPIVYSNYTNYLIFGSYDGSKIAITNNGVIAELNVKLQDLQLSMGGNSYPTLDIASGMDVTLLIDGTTNLSSTNMPVIRVAEGASLTIKSLDESNPGTLNLTSTGSGTSLELAGEVEIEGNVNVNLKSEEGRAISVAEGGKFTLSNACTVHSISALGVLLNSFSIADNCTFTSYSTAGSALTISDSDSIQGTSKNGFLNFTLDNPISATSFYITNAERTSSANYNLNNSETMQLISASVFMPEGRYTVDLYDGTNYTYLYKEENASATAVFNVVAGGGYFDFSKGCNLDNFSC